MVVALTPPPDCVNVIGDVNVPPEVVDNSNPVGAVNVILASKPYPVIEKLFSEDTVPEQELKLVSVPDVAISGGVAKHIVKVPLLETEEPKL